MDSWHATFLGLRHLPREVTAFEIEVFFQLPGRTIQRCRPRFGLAARDVPARSHVDRTSAACL